LRKKVEMLFAHLKRILRLNRLRLRGPNGAQFEFTPSRHLVGLRLGDRAGDIARRLVNAPRDLPARCRWFAMGQEETFCALPTQ
jgi:hypothetical protein